MTRTSCSTKKTVLTLDLYSFVGRDNSAKISVVYPCVPAGDQAGRHPKIASIGNFKTAIVPRCGMEKGQISRAPPTEIEERLDKREREDPIGRGGMRLNSPETTAVRPPPCPPFPPLPTTLPSLLTPPPFVPPPLLAQVPSPTTSPPLHNSVRHPQMGENMEGDRPQLDPPSSVGGSTTSPPLHNSVRHPQVGEILRGTAHNLILHHRWGGGKGRGRGPLSILSGGEVSKGTGTATSRWDRSVISFQECNTLEKMEFLSQLRTM